MNYFYTNFRSIIIQPSHNYYYQSLAVTQSNGENSGTASMQLISSKNPRQSEIISCKRIWYSPKELRLIRTVLIEKYGESITIKKLLYKNFIPSKEMITNEIQSLMGRILRLWSNRWKSKHSSIETKQKIPASLDFGRIY